MTKNLCCREFLITRVTGSKREPEFIFSKEIMDFSIEEIDMLISALVRFNELNSLNRRRIEKCLVD